MIDGRPAPDHSGESDLPPDTAQRVVRETGARADVPPEVARPPRSYLLEIDEARGTISFLHGAERFTCDRRGADIVFATTVGIDTVDFIAIDTATNAIAVRTHSAGLFPAFHRIIAGRMRLSNYSHLLLVPGEQVEVKAQIVAHQLVTRSPRKLYSPFAAVQRLQDNAEYRLSGGAFVLSRSRFFQVETPSYDRLREHLVRHFRVFAAERRPIAIPLSGGYDSRLILVLALHACKEAGGSEGLIRTYHEGIKERDIAARVAASVGVRFDVFQRTDSPEFLHALSQERDFVYTVGLHRSNILRWARHIRRMQELQGDAVRVIGLSGGEPHKGLYYRRVEDMDRDLVGIFGGGDSRERAVALQFHAGKYENFLAPAVQSLTRQAKDIYEPKASRIDFVFYHVHIGEGYGARNRYFSDEFGIDFPPYDEGFMNEVFSVSQKEKEGFGIVKRLINETGSDAVSVPYMSKNYERLRPKPTVGARIENRLKRLLYPPRAKMPEAVGTVIEHEPASALTEALAVATRAGHPLIRVGDTNIAYNYFAMLERDLGVGFSLV